MKEQIILHVDANSFYASVECSKHPELKNLPVAVSGNPEKRNGIILAKNELAKKCGVTTGEPIWQAITKCPNLICIYPNMKLYEEYSSKMRNIFKKYTHLIEDMGLDECWLDITDTAHLFGGAEQIATDIRKSIKQQLGITVSVGISFCKLFAKLGSDLKKPDAQTVISKENYKHIVYPLPIDSIIGIGNRTTKKLHKMNIFTLGDLVNVPGYILKKNFNVVISNLRKKLMGFDHDKIENIYKPTPPKSIGNGTTTLVDIFSKDDLTATLTFLANRISSRLRHQNYFSNCISVGIRDCNLHIQHASQCLPYAINSTQDIVHFAMQIINKFWTFDEKIRSVRISCSKLYHQPIQQLSFFNTTDNKKTSLNTAIDIIREKYGKNSIQPAILMSAGFLRDNFNMI